MDHTDRRAREAECVSVLLRERLRVCEKARERESEREKDDSVSISSRVEIFVDRGRAVFKLDPPKKIPPKNSEARKTFYFCSKVSHRNKK